MHGRPTGRLIRVFSIGHARAMQRLRRYKEGRTRPSHALDFYHGTEVMMTSHGPKAKRHYQPKSTGGAPCTLLSTTRGGPSTDGRPQCYFSRCRYLQ
jgi:hypothetical protein